MGVFPIFCYNEPMTHFLRQIASLCFVSLGCLASASFDVLLQGDYDANQFGHIDRYDPVSRVYLGSFQVGFTLPEHMVTDVARSIVYVRTSINQVQMYNYSTGALLESLTLNGSQLCLSDDGTFLYSLSGGQLRGVNVYSGNGVTPLTLSGLGTDTGGFAFTPNGLILAADNTNARYRLFNSTGGLIFNNSYLGGVTDVEQVSLNRNDGFSTYSYMGITNLTDSTFNTFVTTTLNSPATVDSGSFFAQLTGVVSAHEGHYLIGTNISSPTSLIAQRRTYAGVAASQFTLSQTTSALGGSAIVLAPEPGTMIALGAGVLALLKRRKKA